MTMLRSVRGQVSGVRYQASGAAQLCRMGLAWQKVNRQRARRERAAARHAAYQAEICGIWARATEDNADRDQAVLLRRCGFERWCADYLTSPAFRLLPSGPMVEERPVPDEQPVLVDAAARFLVQHPVELERELAAAARYKPWGPQKPDHELRRLCRALVRPQDRKHFDQMLEQADAYHQERREALQQAPAFRIDQVAVGLPRPPVKSPQPIAAVIQQMEPLPTRIYRTRTRDDDVEDAPELPFVKWTDERLYYRETPDAARERFWERATVQKMLAMGTLAVRGPRPAWARPLERHEREALQEKRAA